MTDERDFGRFIDAKGMDRRLSKQQKAEEVVASVLGQCKEVLDRHMVKPRADFNDDAVFRGLVTEMLEMRTQALVKVDWLASESSIFPTYHLKRPLVSSFRLHMTKLAHQLRQSRNADEGLSMCKRYGLVLSNVDEKNGQGETPLIKASADGVSIDKLELLLLAGCSVNASDDEGKTALYVAAELGRVSTVELLHTFSADVNVCSNYEIGRAHV